MTRGPLLAAAVLAAAWPLPAHACPQPRASAASTRAVAKVLASGRDVLGERLLRAPGGPTYARAARLLPPLLYARTSGDRPLTDSGVYYVPFGRPDGSGRVFLHVADGGEVLAQRVGGPKLTISVAGERYGSCVARLAQPRLADGWLPILETRYRGYRQESFAAPLDGRLAAFVSLSGPGGLRVGPLRQRGGTLLAAWDGRRVRRVSPADYDAARASVADYWERRLAAGAQLVVPERRVMDAQRALLVQNLELGWRYSLGNPYEEFSWPESVDDLQVLAEYGFAGPAREALLQSYRRRPEPYANWKMGEKLLGTAVYVRLSGDRAFVARSAPLLRGYVRALARQLGSDGLLDRERYSSDIGDRVLGLHGQAVAWQGLREMADVWAGTGHGSWAAEARAAAARLGRGLRRAVAASQRRLPDGSLFVPVRLLEGRRPYGALTASRDGSYWNLVMPYALASGLFPPGSAQARGILAYMDRHGSQLLGLVRAGAFSLYGRGAYPASGTDQVYGLNTARFLADQGEADRLVLELYGQLAAGMTPGTFVAGEGASVAPLHGLRGRAMYLPPNATSNAAFLETLRLTLVHETPTELELAPATPRAWLAPGKRVEVRDLPTRFGPLSYGLEAGPKDVQVTVTVPPRRPRKLLLRLRLPGATRTVDLSGRSGTIRLAVARPARTS